jgi:hypothetical protein
MTLCLVSCGFSTVTGISERISTFWGKMPTKTHFRSYTPPSHQKHTGGGSFLVNSQGLIFVPHLYPFSHQKQTGGGSFLWTPKDWSLSLCLISLSLYRRVLSFLYAFQPSATWATNRPQTHFVALPPPHNKNTWGMDNYWWTANDWTSRNDYWQFLDIIFMVSMDTDWAVFSLPKKNTPRR